MTSSRTEAIRFCAVNGTVRRTALAGALDSALGMSACSIVLTRWVEGGHRYEVMPRQLLPGETEECPAI